MKTRIPLLRIIVLMLVLSAAACTPPATQPTATLAPATQAPVEEVSPTENPSSEIILSMVERLNAGDVDGSLAYFADDARVYLMGFPPTGIEVYAGKEQIRQLWEDSVSNHFEWDVEVSSITGNIVYIEAKTWHDFTRQLEVAPLEYHDVYEINEGKIITYGSWLTGDSLARFKPAFYEVMPPEPTAGPSGDPPRSELVVTIAGGTCTTNHSGPLPTGEVTVTLDVQDQDNTLYALTLFNLQAEKDYLDLMVSTYGMPPSWASFLLFEELGPGKRETFTITVEKGPVYLVCWSKPPDLPIGNAGPFEVSPFLAATEPTAPVPEGPVSELSVTFAKGSCQYNGSTILQAGEVMVTMDIQDQSKESYALSFFNLDEGKTKEDLIKAQNLPAPPPWAEMFSLQDALPGDKKTYSIMVEKGPVYMLCWSPERVIGSKGPFEVAH